MFELGNILSRRNARTCIVPANCGNLTYPERTGTELSTMLIWYLREMQLEHITSHTVRIDSYVSQLNASYTIVPDVMRYINNDSHERSTLEEGSLRNIVDSLFNELPVERLVQHMCILSPYHVHCDFVRQMLRSRYKLNQAIKRAPVDAIGTVSFCKGLE